MLRCTRGSLVAQMGSPRAISPYIGSVWSTAEAASVESDCRSCCVADKHQRYLETLQLKHCPVLRKFVIEQEACAPRSPPCEGNGNAPWLHSTAPLSRA